MTPAGQRHALNGGLVLGLSAFVCLALLVLLSRCTAERVQAAETALLQARISALLPAGQYDNDPLLDSLEWPAGKATDTPSGNRTIWLARQQGQPVAAILSATAPLGYNGPITLLVGVDYTGEILGVHVLNHRETPGLGDQIEPGRSDWIHQFDGRSLVSDDTTGWRVKADGGNFDHMTGATITPRAVVAAVHDTLQFYQTYRDRLYAIPTERQ